MATLPKPRKRQQVRKPSYSKFNFQNLPAPRELGLYQGNPQQMKFYNEGFGAEKGLAATGSTGAYSWAADPINVAAAEKATGQKWYKNPFLFTGGNPNTGGDYEGVNFEDPLERYNLATNNRYGSDRQRFDISKFGPKAPGADAPNTGKTTGVLGKLGTWAGDHAMDVANLGLNIWGGIQKNKALDQQDQYLKDVRQAMAFDQADVNRRWNLAMGDYRVREEDQNQYRTAQGMENKKTNFSTDTRQV